MTLSATLKTIQDILRKDDGVDGDAQRIGQLTWMLFLKVLDHQEYVWEAEAVEQGQRYESPLPNQFRWRSWAAGSNGNNAIPAKEIIRFVNEDLFPTLKTLPLRGRPMADVIRAVFEDSVNYMKTGTLMRGVIEKLEADVNLSDFRERKNLGDVYEQILNDLRAAGNAGEFYTPRAVTQLMVHLVNPNFNMTERVFDPACGTGGFLTAALSHLQAQTRNGTDRNVMREIAERVVGIEKKQLPHLLCITNLLLHGVEVPNHVTRRNTLAVKWTDWSESDQVDCVVTNPPFGGLEEEGVGADFPALFRTRETSDMFLTLIVEKMLKSGGRGAIVLPDGLLFGVGVKARIKKLLTDKCDLHTIVRLPGGVFSPYTNIKTNLLFFTKGRPTNRIWYFEHRYPEGQRSYSKTKPIKIEEFDALKDWWGKEDDGFASREESDQAWMIDFAAKRSAAETVAKPLWSEAATLLTEASALENRARMEDGISAARLGEEAESVRTRARELQAKADTEYWPIYNLDVKNPFREEEEVRDPEELIEELSNLNAEIADATLELTQALASALARHLQQGAN